MRPAWPIYTVCSVQPVLRSNLKEKNKHDGQEARTLKHLWRECSTVSLLHKTTRQSLKQFKLCVANHSETLLWVYVWGQEAGHGGQPCAHAFTAAELGCTKSASVKRKGHGVALKRTSAVCKTLLSFVTCCVTKGQQNTGKVNSGHWARLHLPQGGHPSHLYCPLPCEALKPRCTVAEWTCLGALGSSPTQKG